MNVGEIVSLVGALTFGLGGMGAAYKYFVLPLFVKIKDLIGEAALEADGNGGSTLAARLAANDVRLQHIEATLTTIGTTLVAHVALKEQLAMVNAGLEELRAHVMKGAA